VNIKKAGLREGFVPYLSTQSGAKCEDFVCKSSVFRALIVTPFKAGINHRAYVKATARYGIFDISPDLKMRIYSGAILIPYHRHYWFFWRQDKLQLSATGE
jgi:hypothetical protein